MASPWPLDDLEARKLIDELSARLGRGETLGDALAGAKRARLRDGAPVLAWAGLQLHGDGSVAVRPVSTAWRWSLVLLAVAVVFLVSVALVTRARRQREMRSPAVRWSV